MDRQPVSMVLDEKSRRGATVIFSDGSQEVVNHAQAEAMRQDGKVPVVVSVERT
jgi:hypothetical protein